MNSYSPNYLIVGGFYLETSNYFQFVTLFFLRKKINYFLEQFISFCLKNKCIYTPQNIDNTYFCTIEKRSGKEYEEQH